MADQQKTSPRIVSVSATADTVIPANPYAKGRTFQCQSPNEVVGIEIRNEADAVAGDAGGTRAGTVGFVLAAAPAGKRSGGTIAVDSPREFRFRSLADDDSPVNLYVFEDD